MGHLSWTGSWCELKCKACIFTAKAPLISASKLSPIIREDLGFAFALSIAS